MKRLVASFIAAGCALACLPLVAAAQCEGGPTIAGMYAPDGTYVPTHCAYTNPTTPGQLYPSGAQAMPSTNPAAGGSALPGQRYRSGLLPVNSSDLGPAPSYVSTPSTAAGGTSAPGVAGTLPLTSTGTASASGLPSEFPLTGIPALNGNRAVPGSLAAPNTAAPGTIAPNQGSYSLFLNQSNLAYSYSLPAAPPRETAVTPQPAADGDDVVVTYPNQ